MPTQRPRLTVTETPEVARRLDIAAAHFPALASSRKDLLLQLTEVAEQTLVDRGRMEDNPRSTAKRRLLQRSRALSDDDAEAMLAAREADWQPERGS
jgi:hypothetical protein